MPALVVNCGTSLPVLIDGEEVEVFHNEAEAIVALILCHLVLHGYVLSTGRTMLRSSQTSRDTCWISTMTQMCRGWFLHYLRSLNRK